MPHITVNARFLISIIWLQIYKISANAPTPFASFRFCGYVRHVFANLSFLCCRFRVSCLKEFECPCNVMPLILINGQACRSKICKHCRIFYEHRRNFCKHCRMTWQIYGSFFQQKGLPVILSVIFKYFIFWLLMRMSGSVAVDSIKKQLMRVCER